MVQNGTNKNQHQDWHQGETYDICTINSISFQRFLRHQKSTGEQNMCIHVNKLHVCAEGIFE